MNMAISIVLVLYKIALFTNKLWESCCEIFDILLLYHILFVSVFSLVSYRNMLLSIVLCCGMGRACLTPRVYVASQSNAISHVVPPRSRPRSIN